MIQIHPQNQAHQYSSSITYQQNMKPEPSFSISRSSPPPLSQVQMKRKCETALTSTLSGRRWNFSIGSVVGRHRIFPRIDDGFSDATSFPDIDLELAKMRNMTPEEAEIAAAEAVAEAEAAIAAAEAAHQEAEAAESEYRAAQADLEEALKNERARRIRRGLNLLGFIVDP